MKLVFNRVYIILIALSVWSCESEADKAYRLAVVQERSDKNLEFALDKGPLDGETRQTFTGLSYFPISKDYVLLGELAPFPQPTSVLLEQGDTVKRMLRYGKANFNWQGQEQALLVYKPVPDPLMQEEDYLFIPFFDATNKQETYDGGRYVYPVINEDGALEIDFNRASNPYCAYNHKFNCIVPPAENTLDFPIKAGEKAFH